MTENQVETQAENQQISDKELNFRALENKYKRQMEEVNARLAEAERKAQEYQKAPDDDDDDEPYVVPKKLDKKLAKHGEKIRAETQTEIQKAVQTAIYEEKRKNWINQNPDFYDTLKHAEKLYQKDQELADTILEMPEGFERQKLVYKSIKALGLDQPEKKASGIQDKIDANKRSPYYQPTGVAGPGYAMQGDFSPSGQKNAYDKMKELQRNARIG